MPNFDDRVGVPGSPVGLHHGAKGNSRGCNPVVVHLVQRLLQLHHVTSLPQNVQQGVEDDLINVLLLLVYEGLHEANPPAHAALVRGRLQAFRQDGDEVLVCLGKRANSQDLAPEPVSAKRTLLKHCSLLRLFVGPRRLFPYEAFFRFGDPLPKLPSPNSQTPAFRPHRSRRSKTWRAASGSEG